MPESPEIATYKANLQPLLTNQTLINIEVLSGRYQRHPEDWKINIPFPIQIQEIKTHGKLMIWDLDHGHKVFITAGMTGKWNTQPNEKHNHVAFHLLNHSSIYFNDTRNFGTIQFGSKADENRKLAKLGPDPLKTEVTYDRICWKLSRFKTIGELCLDQGFVAGLGNYLRSEILYAAKISPFRISTSLTFEEIDRFLDQVNTLPKLSFQLGGATLRDYQSIDGRKGQFSERFAVYGRKTDPYGNRVVRKLDNTKRAIWYVPELQQ